MRWSRAVRRNIGWSAVCALVLALVVSGCASPLGGSPSATQVPTGATQTTPTIPAAPATPTIHTLPITASLAIPGAQGLLLYPASATATFAGLPSLQFYRYTDQQIITIATAPTEPDGSTGGIINGSYYGADWVSYVTENAQQGNWILWAYNLTTGQQMQLDSQAQEGSTVGWGNQFSNATDIVWAVYKGSSSGISSTIFDYTFATGATRTLVTNQTNILKVLAVSASAVLFAIVDPNGNGATTWVQQLEQGSAKKISDDAGVNAWLTSRYAVWDNPHTSSTEVYDLSTGKFNPSFAPCLRPAVGDPQPYMVCLQFNADAWLLVNMNTGAQTAFDAGMASQSDGGQIYNGRAFIIGANNTVAYFDLPSQ